MLGKAVSITGMMMKVRDNKGEPEPPGPEREGGRRHRAEAGFDRWLTDRLHDLYDPVLKEQVPDDLERLLDRFASRSGKPKS
jgi:hypothetical protein